MEIGDVYKTFEWIKDQWRTHPFFRLYSAFCLAIFTLFVCTSYWEVVSFNTKLAQLEIAKVEQEKEVNILNGRTSGLHDEMEVREKYEKNIFELKEIIQKKNEQIIDLKNKCK